MPSDLVRMAQNRYYSANAVTAGLAVIEQEPIKAPTIRQQRLSTRIS